MHANEHIRPPGSSHPGFKIRQGYLQQVKARQGRAGKLDSLR